MKQHGIAVFALSLAAAVVGNAQERATLSGTVKDKSGAVVPGAKVIVARIENSDVTGDAGTFSIPELKPGRYTVIVEGVGWTTETIADLRIGDTGASISVVLDPKRQPVQVYDRLDPFWKDWYPKFLTVMREPDFCNASSAGAEEAYRFLWLPSFDNPVLVKLKVLPNGSGVVETKILSGQGGYEPGVLKKSTKKKIPKENVEWFRRILESDVDFWNMPTAIWDPNVVGVDGAMWVTEGWLGGKCHVVERWSPETSAYRGLGLTFLLDLAKLKLLYREVY